MRSVWNRRAMMGVFGGAVLFSAISVAWVLTSLPQHQPRVGDLPPMADFEDYPLQAGDLILSVNNQTVSSWEELILLVNDSQSDDIELEVERTGVQEKKKVTFPTRKLKKHLGILNCEPGAFSDLNYVYQSNEVGVKNGSPIQRMGVETADRVLSIEGERVVRFSDISRILEKTPLGVPLNLEVQKGRGDAKGQVLSLGLPALEETRFSVHSLGLEPAQFTVFQVNNGGFGKKVGLLPFDRILMIQGLPYSRTDLWPRIMERLEAPGELVLQVLRGDSVQILKLPPSEVPSLAYGPHLNLRQSWDLRFYDSVRVPEAPESEGAMVSLRYWWFLRNCQSEKVQDQSKLINESQQGSVG